MGQASTLEGMDSYTDVRYDEEYKAFYERFPDKSQLPRPFDDKNTLYNGHMQMFMSPHPYKDPTGFPVTSGFRAGNQFGLGFTNQPSLGRGGESIPFESFLTVHRFGNCCGATSYEEV